MKMQISRITSCIVSQPEHTCLRKNYLLRERTICCRLRKKIDFYRLANSDDVNCSMNNIIKVLQDITDKHAPIKKVTNAKKRQLKKPWISNGILNSIKTKQKMFKPYFLSHDQVKVNFFKKYNNKLNKIKELAKRTYFSTQFYLNNIKMTWKLIGMIINRKKKSNIIIPKLLHNNSC